VVLVPGPVTDESGAEVSDVGVVVPAEIPTVGSKAEVPVSLALVGVDDLSPGTYRFTVGAHLGDTQAALLAGSFRLPAPGASVTIAGGAAAVRQGDVATYVAEVRDSLGMPTASAVHWSIEPASAGLMTAGGRFVGYQVGSVDVIARAGTVSDTLTVTVSGRGLSGDFTVIGAGIEAGRFSSDLWVYGGAAYSGTWSSRTVNGVTRIGNALNVWDVSDPASPVLTDSVVVDARVVNDVKVRADGGLAVITHEGATDGLNGITLLDLADPLHPAIVTRFTTSIENGVHNVWLDGDELYVAVDGGNDTGGLRILDIGDPANPSVLASFYGGASLLHDVYVRDGLAFLAHWDAGLIVLDVGNGLGGGSPANPVEVSRILTEGGQTHNAWYWPDGGYVFVGEEDFGTPGRMHVIDVRDLANPAEVATFDRATVPPHNFWLDEDREILYAAWYDEGVVAIDVSGELLGDLARQGRVYASLRYGGSGACPSSGGAATCAWAPQLENGFVYVSDMNRGLVVLQPTF
jgi:hypothetical protein